MRLFRPLLVVGGFLAARALLLQPRLSDADRCILIHERAKPWIRGFRRVLIRPLRKVKREWLGRPVVIRGQTWHVPTRAFWQVHCKASHDGGAGCNVEVHTAFLTTTGKNAEFEYGYQTYQGTVVVEQRADFEKECVWWGQFFPSWRP